jgi:hypothetical protein
MKTQTSKGSAVTARRPGAPNGRPVAEDGDWRSRVQRPRITDPEERRATIERATSRIKTDVRVDITRERRGR